MSLKTFKIYIVQNHLSGEKNEPNNSRRVLYKQKDNPEWITSVEILDNGIDLQLSGSRSVSRIEMVTFCCGSSDGRFEFPSVA